MDISEKLYKLRKQSGLSQEQLAERLNVSRQAVSKWETGTSLPESDKLIAISDFFNVPLDNLLREADEKCTPKEHARQPKIARSGRFGIKTVLGITAFIGGIICLITWGLMSIISPSSANQVAASSAITLNGNGILLIICIIAITLGAILLLKGPTEK